MNMGKDSKGNIVLFYDKNIKTPPDETGYNQIGVLIEDDTILFKEGRKLKEKTIKSWNYKPNSVYTFDEPNLTEKVANYFLLNRYNVHLFKLGLSQIWQNNFNIFDHSTLMPPRTNYNSLEEFEKRWDLLESDLKKIDLIFTFDKKSIVSSIIANIDSGSWSHVAMYVGDGKISEMIASGFNTCELRVFKQERFQVGVYRLFQKPTQEQVEGILDYLNLCKDTKYGYLQLLSLGVQKLLGIYNKVPVATHGSWR